MSAQMLREIKRVLRDAIQLPVTDEKLCEMIAWAQDRKMVWACGCTCFVGSLGARRVHERRGCGPGGDADHYRRYAELFPEASRAYLRLGIEDEQRQRRVVPILKAELRLRERRVRNYFKEASIHAGYLNSLTLRRDLHQLVLV